MGTPSSQTFNKLLKATTADEIIDATSTCVWEAEGNEPPGPSPTLTELQTFTKTTETPGWTVLVRSSSGRYDVYDDDEMERLAQVTRRTIAVLPHRKNPDFPTDAVLSMPIKTLQEVKPQWSSELIEHFAHRIFLQVSSHQGSKDQDNPSELTSAQRKALATTQDLIDAFYKVPPEHFMPISQFILRTNGEPSNERLKWLQKAWLRARKLNPTLPHPLGNVIKEWQQDQLAKPITKEYDTQYPVAVLKSPLGSIKEVNFLDSDAANLREFAPPERQEQTDQYLFDFASKTISILPAVMPLDVAHPLGVRENTRKGAVHHVIRVFFEALMALEPMQTEGNIVITLGDLISYLYPHGKFHRTNQLPYIINALDILHFYATVPYRTESGGTGRWRPVVVRNIIDASSRADDGIYMDVKLPPDATQGMMVEKQIMRHLGHESAPRFNAYLMACWLWDKFGTGKKGLIDPTKPVEIRDTTGDLLNAKGEKIFDKRGQPIQNPYHEEAITQLTRERNPAADRYPIVTFDDLILACKPSGYDPKRQKRELDRALKHWEQLATEGVVQIEKHSDGWRIMPGKSHIVRYRGLRKAAKKTR